MFVDVLYTQGIVQGVQCAAQNVQTQHHLQRLLCHHYKQQQIRSVQQLKIVHIVQVLKLFHLLHRIHPHLQAVCQLY